MRTALLIVAAIMCAGCTQLPTYEDGQAFEREIASWHLVGRTLAERSAILSGEGFTCCQTAVCPRRACEGAPNNATYEGARA
jgi:hypothetical protein